MPAHDEADKARRPTNKTEMNDTRGRLFPEVLLHNALIANGTSITVLPSPMKFEVADAVARETASRPVHTKTRVNYPAVCFICVSVLLLLAALVELILNC